MVTISGHQAVRAAPVHGLQAQHKEQGRFADLEVSCRRCPSCLRLRANVWKFRALAEIESARRTWFGTITLSPEQHFRMKCQAIRALGPSVVFEQMSEAEQFAARHRQINIELTKYFKRLRKDRPEGLRFLLVAEAHKSGLPHYHCLIHENRESDATVGRRDLEAQWTLGFTKWRLVKDGAAAFYVCKYLAKSSQARVRASIRYGECDAYFAELNAAQASVMKF